MKTKTLKTLKAENNGDLTAIKSLEDLIALAANFIRMVSWKKEKDLDKIAENCTEVIPFIIKGIKKNGYNEYLKQVKNGDLHKAYNLKYLYNLYGLDYMKIKAENRKTKKELL